VRLNKNKTLNKNKMKLNYLTLEIEKIENDIANGKSSLSYKERLIEFKAIKQALTIPVVVKSLPCGDEIWLKAQETDRFLFEEWFDELK
tara:strand:+ start:484 stop:750 length:267 start_codon:yes stop_codon:yes gene_type:complete